MLLQMSAKMRVTAMGGAPALTFKPLVTPPSSASAIAGGLETTVSDVSQVQFDCALLHAILIL